MNCMEFRRAALANPHHPGHEALAHEAVCHSCANFYQELRMQEESLYEAMSVPVPDGLADRVLLRQQHGWRERFMPRFAVPALAASMALVVALGLNWKFQSGMLSPEMLAAGIIEHVEQEEKALNANQTIPSNQLVSLFERNGAILDKAPGETTYADHCPLPGGGHGEHLVFDTPHGKLTLILMPDKAIGRPLRLDKDGLTVSLLPAGEGSIALVSGKRDQINEAETWARESLRWQRGRT